MVASAEHCIDQLESCMLVQVIKQVIAADTRPASNWPGLKTTCKTDIPKQCSKGLNLGRQVVRQDVIGAPQDEVIAVLIHLLLPLSGQLHLLVSCTWLPSSQNGSVIVLSEVRRALKHLGVAEASHSIELHA